jgi:sugar (pentulose or hexulose) kinase
MKMFFIGLDLGATYIKSARIDAEEFSMNGIERIPFPSFDGNYGKTVSMRRILDSVSQAIQVQLSSHPEKCQGVLLSNQMHGLVLMREKDFCSPFISWQDLRCLESEDGVSSFQKLKNRLGIFSVLHETGEYLRPGFPITQLFRLQGMGEKLGVVCDLGSAIVSALTENPVQQIHMSNAAATGCWDIKKGDWHRDIIRTAKIDCFDWPGVVVGEEVLGYLKWGGRTIPVYPSVGDQQVSLLGAGLWRDDQVSFNIATGSQVSRLSSEFQVGDFQTRPYFQGRYLQTITHLPAGRALNALLKLFTELSPQLDLDLAWTEVTRKVDHDLSFSSRLKVNLGFFPSAIGNEGSLTGLTEENLNVSSVLKACFVSIVQNHIEALKRINQDSRQISEYIGSGGIMQKSRFLQSAFYNYLGEPIRLSEQSEDALWGLASRTREIAR